MNIDFQTLFPSDILITSDGCVISVKKVTTYDTELPQLNLPESFKTNVHEDWFNDLSDLRIMCLNGYNLSEYSDPVACNYCNHSCDYSSYYCTKCMKHMCLLCFNERNEEEAIKNGAKNYLNRKERLNYCFAHEDQFQKIDHVVCDICKVRNSVLSGTWRSKITNKCERKDICPMCLIGIQNPNNFCTSEPDSRMCDLCNDTKKKDNVWFQGPNESDICPACIKEILSDTYSDVTYNTPTFGSMLEWIPLVQDKEYHTLFYNMDINSPNYHKVALASIDDHGRYGLYIIEKNLDDIVTELKELDVLFKSKFKEDENSWKKHYSYPICKAMRNRGLEVHFG